jgi:ATP-dependent DNA ligase
MVTSIMGSLPEEAVRKQRERGWLHYVVFDCLFYKGRDLRKLKLIDRQNYIESVISDWCPRYAMDVPKSISERYHRKMYDKIVERGGEGIIFKRKDHLYGDKTGWVKVKKTLTADVVILGFVSAKEMSKKKGDDKPTMTKYAKEGLIGAIICSQLAKDGWVEVATISGITDALRRDMTKNPGRYEHRVVEIEHNGREPSGRFRHPRFNRFREDKQPLECVYREDES